jgi:hypothetical protein
MIPIPPKTPIATATVSLMAPSRLRNCSRPKSSTRQLFRLGRAAQQTRDNRVHHRAGRFFAASIRHFPERDAVRSMSALGIDGNGRSWPIWARSGHDRGAPPRSIPRCPREIPDRASAPLRPIAGAAAPPVVGPARMAVSRRARGHCELAWCDRHRRTGTVTLTPFRAC